MCIPILHRRKLNFSKVHNVNLCYNFILHKLKEATGFVGEILKFICKFLHTNSEKYSLKVLF